MKNPLHAQSDEFLRVLQDEQSRSPNTITAYRNDLAQFTRYIEDSLLPDGTTAGRAPGITPAPPAVNWAQVDPALFANYVSDLNERGYAASTITRKVAVIRTFYQWLQRAGGMQQVPELAFDTPKPQPAILTPLQPDEIERLLAEAQRESTPHALRDGALLHLLCTLGLRVTEVVNLDDSSIDLERATLVCAGSKRKRQIALPDAVRDALARYLAEGRLHLQVDPAERALFLNHRGKRLTRQGLWLIVKRYAALVGIAPDVTPHMLRQSFALHQIDRGLDPKRYADAMGSSSRRSGQDYRRMAERFDGAPNTNSDGKARGTIVIDGKPYRTKDK